MEELISHMPTKERILLQKYLASHWHKRKTGHTTKMVEEAIKSASLGHLVTIVVGRQDQVYGLAQLLHEKCGPAAIVNITVISVHKYYEPSIRPDILFFDNTVEVKLSVRV